jgi:hypothetical protein
MRFPTLFTKDKKYRSFDSATHPSEHRPLAGDPGYAPLRMTGHPAFDEYG